MRSAASADRCQYRQKRSCHFLGVSVAICRVAQSTVCSIIAMRRAKSRRVMLSVPSCGNAKKACFASVPVAFCTVAPSLAMLSNAVRSAQPRFKSDRCQYRQKRSCHFLGVSVAICRVTQYRGCQYRQRPRTVVRSMSVPAWSAQCQYRRN